MTIAEARCICPPITICSVPIMENIRKADLARYRSASEEVFRIFDSFNNITIEKASVDEAYLDVSAMIDAELEASAALDKANSREKYSTILQNVIFLVIK